MMADGNYITASGYTFRLCASIPTPSVSHSGTQTTISFTGEFWIDQGLSWTGSFSLDNYYNDTSLGSTYTRINGYSEGSVNQPYTNYWARYWYVNANGLTFNRKGSDYTVNLRAVVSTPWGNSTVTVPVTVPKLDLPGAPGKPSVTRNSDTSHSLSWTAASNVVSKYDVYRKTNGGSYTYIGNTTSTSYTDTTTAANSYYQYYVVAVNAAGSTSGSASNTVYTTPAAPTGGALSYEAPSSISMSWSNPGVTEESVILQKSTDNVNWTTLATLAANSTSHSYTEGSTGTKYFRVYNSGHGMNSGTLSLGSVLVISAPAATSTPTVVRNSDNQNTISFTNNSTTAAPYANILVMRRVNGGTASQLASISAGATSYVDTATSANNSYEYYTVAVNAAGTAPSSWSSISYNTPSALTNIAASYQSGSSVLLTWGNPGNTETAVEVQRTADGGTTWTTIATLAADTTQYTDASAPGGTLKYRARNTRSALVSAWATTGDVVTIQPPAAPTVSQISPNYPVNDPTVDFSWQHNSLDGSAQTKAELSIEVVGGSTQVVTITGAAQTSNYDFAANAVDGKAINYKVRTWGADATAGPWSAIKTFTFRSIPGLSITEPSNDAFVLELLPQPITIEYDNNYDMASAAVVLIDNTTGRVVYSWQSLSDLALSVDTFFPINGRSYTIKADATSVVSQAAPQVTRQFTVDYTLPESPVIAANFNEELLAVDFTISSPPSTPDIEYMFLTRVMGDETELPLYTRIEPGSNIAIRDNTPLLNTTNIYRAWSVSDQGTLEYAEIEVETPCQRWYVFNYGQEMEHCVALLAFVTDSENPKRTTNVYHVSGRERPVEFRGEHYSQPITLTADLLDYWGDMGDDEQLYKDLLALQRADTSILLRRPGGSAIYVKVPDLTFGYNGDKDCRSVSISTEAVYSANMYMIEVD